MEQQELKQYEGSVDIKELLYALINTKNMHPKTIGHFWNSEVSCRACPYITKCEALTSTLALKGKAPDCSEVVSILLGEQTIESFLAEDYIPETKYVIN